MEIETTIQEMSGSFYVRIPALMAEYLKLSNIKGARTKDKAKIKDVSNNKVEITFPLLTLI